MEKLLAVIGAISSIFGIGYLGYYLFNKVEWKLPSNPLKSYIRKEVMAYLKELSND